MAKILEHDEHKDEITFQIRVPKKKEIIGEVKTHSKSALRQGLFIARDLLDEVIAAMEREEKTEPEKPKE